MDINSNPSRHAFVIDIRGDNGANLCVCPVCGRIIALQPYPYKKIIIVEGDLHASHAFLRDDMDMQTTLPEGNNPWH